MNNLEETLTQLYDISELTKRLTLVLVQKIKTDIERIGNLSESDRVHLIGILGLN